MLLAFAGDDKAYREQLMMETLISIRRAGADMIITYFAPAAARVLNRQRTEISAIASEDIRRVWGWA